MNLKLCKVPTELRLDFMTKKIKKNSGILYNAKHRISSSPSSTICFDFNSMVYYYIIFVQGEKTDIKSTESASILIVLVKDCERINRANFQL